MIIVILHPSLPHSHAHTEYTSLFDLVLPTSSSGHIQRGIDAGAAAPSKALWETGREVQWESSRRLAAGHRHPPMTALQPLPWQQQCLMEANHPASEKCGFFLVCFCGVFVAFFCADLNRKSRPSCSRHWSSTKDKCSTKLGFGFFFSYFLKILTWLRNIFFSSF